MAAQDDAKTALLTEHFGFTPITLIDDIINAMNALLYQGVSGVETFLLNTPPKTTGFELNKENPDALTPAAETEILEGTHRLETLLESTIDRNFDKFEIFVLRSIVNVPDALRDWIRLSHYENLNFDHSPDAPTEASLRALQAKYRATLHLQALLQREKTRNANLIVQLRSLLTPSSQGEMDKETPTSPLQFLAKSLSAPDLGVPSIQSSSSAAVGNNKTPLTDSARFAVSQLPHLKSLLASLKPKLDVPMPDSIEASDERRQYLETQTRRHLEVTKGVELLEDGTVRDGEWQDGGERVNMAKVRDLERVVQEMAGSEDADVSMDED